jgi:nickel/cobalt exporter
MLDWLVSLQTIIHGIVSDDIAGFAASGDLVTLWSLLPLAIGLGAVHALTPGHNKLVLATYLVGERPPIMRALGMSALLSLTHIASAVFIALGANWLVSRTITSSGQAPILEISSRLLLVAIGAWMVLRALRHGSHAHGQGAIFAIAAGLIPCPLTLFIMFYAMTQGVPQAGLVFASAMLIGVGSVLCLVGIASTLAAGFLARNAAAWANGSRIIEGIAGIVLIAVGAVQLLS